MRIDGVSSPSCRLVSVLIATHRGEHYLAEAIRSALAQSYGPIEVIVSDDEASPVTRDIVAQFGDDRLVYRSNPRPLGPAGNHWCALRAARGSVIGILNQDDVWKSTFLGTLVPELVREPHVAVAFCDHNVIDETGKVLDRATDDNTRYWGRELLTEGIHRPFTGLVVRQSIPVAMAAIFRKAAVPLDSLSLEVGAAYDLWLSYLLSRMGQAAYYCRQRLTSWRVHPQSLTARADPAWGTGAAYCWRALSQDVRFRPYRKLIVAKIAENLAAVSLAYLRAGQSQEAQTYAGQAMQMQRKNWRAVLAWVLSFLPGGLARTILNLSAFASRLSKSPPSRSACAY